MSACGCSDGGALSPSAAHPVRSGLSSIRLSERKFLEITPLSSKFKGWLKAYHKEFQEAGIRVLDNGLKKHLKTRQ